MGPCGLCEPASGLKAKKHKRVFLTEVVVCCSLTVAHSTPHNPLAHRLFACDLRPYFSLYSTAHTFPINTRFPANTHTPRTRPASLCRSLFVPFLSPQPLYFVSFFSSSHRALSLITYDLLFSAKGEWLVANTYKGMKTSGGGLFSLPPPRWWLLFSFFFSPPPCRAF